MTFRVVGESVRFDDANNRGSIVVDIPSFQHEASSSERSACQHFLDRKLINNGNLTTTVIITNRKDSTLHCFELKHCNTGDLFTCDRQNPDGDRTSYSSRLASVNAQLNQHPFMNQFPGDPQLRKQCFSRYHPLQNTTVICTCSSCHTRKFFFHAAS